MHNEKSKNLYTSSQGHQNPENQKEVLDAIDSINALMSKKKQQPKVLLLTDKFSYLKALWRYFFGI